jgi:hypothetical protein
MSIKMYRLAWKSQILNKVEVDILDIQLELKELVSEGGIPNLSIIDELPPSVESSE